MRSLTFRSAVLWLIAMAACIGHHQSVFAQQHAAEIPGAETWLRQSVELTGDQDPDLELRLSASDVTSVYFNGQRLVRNESLNGVVSWKVGTLTRSGKNCIAVSSSKANTERKIAAWFPNKPNAKHAQWKMTTEVPPVGWQKTDFNDRDWKVVKSVPADAALKTMKAIELTWASRNASHVQNGRLHFQDGDHVVLLGGTFIERAQQYGHLEAALTSATDNHNVTFRNLGWSADTVFAESRGIFDTPAKGYERMIEHVRAEEPTVILLSYGQNEAMSFEQGEAGVERFKKQLHVLHKDLTTSGAEVVFLTPHPFLTGAPPLPDAAKKWNQRLATFGNAVKSVAAELGALAADLNSDFVRRISEVSAQYVSGGTIGVHTGGPRWMKIARNSMWTDNGMHWNDSGYKVVAPVVAETLFSKETTVPVVIVNLEKETVMTEMGTLQSIEWGAPSGSGVSFEFRTNAVTSRPVVIKLISQSESKPNVRIRSNTHASDFQRVGILGKPGIYVARESPAYEKLRQLVVRKNELYFHRWRPQNITYLFGFRKHEQGNNASDIAKFDPLIDDLEQQIHEAKQPPWQTITVSADK